MRTQFAFRADDITVSLPPDDNFAGDNSSFQSTTAPTDDPVSDAINNVRFACTGFAGHGLVEMVLFTLKTFHTFRFRPQVAGRLVTAHTHFLPQGAMSLTARKPTWLLDRPGFVSFKILIAMRVQVFAANGNRLFRGFRKEKNIFWRTAEARSYSASSEAVVDADLLEFTRSTSVGIQVIPAHTIEVQARYVVQAIAMDGAEFALDFASVPAASGEPGDGLNSPFAVINIED